MPGLRTFSEPTACAIPNPAWHLVPGESVHVKFQRNPHARGLIPELWISPWQRQALSPLVDFHPPNQPRPVNSSTDSRVPGWEPQHSPACISGWDIKAVKGEEGVGGQSPHLLQSSLPVACHNVWDCHPYAFCCLWQKSAKYSLQTKSSPSSAFANKVLLDHGHVHSFLFYPQFLSCYRSRVQLLGQRLYGP